jgi:hypothetical protein
VVVLVDANRVQLRWVTLSVSARRLSCWLLADGWFSEVQRGIFREVIAA